MAQIYGSASYADVVVGLELVNEPISWGNNAFSVTQAWAQEAYAAVRAVTENPNLMIVMHDAFEGPLAWVNVASTLAQSSGGAKRFGIDTHLYQLYTASDNSLTQQQHIAEACSWAPNLTQAKKTMPVYVGEFSAATNICVNPDGSTTPGTNCTVTGCQCQMAAFSSWNASMIGWVRKYIEAQLDVFESSTNGWFMWSANGYGGWGFLNLIQAGIMPNPVTSRMYPRQCF
jgi:glucan 1,3-beta-glucosidase